MRSSSSSSRRSETVQLPASRGPRTPGRRQTELACWRLPRRCATTSRRRGLTGRPIFWRQDKKRILVDLLLFLEADDVYRKAHGTRLLEAELAFGMPGSDLGPVALALPDGRDVKFRGFADRVDVAADGTLHVVDYKTGKADDYKDLSEVNPDARGQRLQLAVYGQAARLHANDPTAAVRAEYWFVSTRGRFERVGYAVTPEVLEHVGATVGAMVEGIEAGVFPHHPTASSTSPWVECPFCDPDGMGVAELRRQYERKTGGPGHGRLRRPGRPGCGRSCRDRVGVAARCLSRAFRAPWSCRPIRPPASGSRTTSTPRSSSRPARDPARPRPSSSGSWHWCSAGTIELRRVAAITFTEKAGAELRDRLRADLGESGRGRPRRRPGAALPGRRSTSSTGRPSARCTPSPSASCPSTRSRPGCRPGSRCSTRSARRWPSTPAGRPSATNF